MALGVTAPKGAHFEMEPVKSAGGTKELGEKPILVWDDLQSALEFYGEEGVKDILDGTSVRVSMQSIARRLGVQGKTDDEIAEAEIKFRPGKRSVGASTPQSRAANQARKAAEKLGDNAQLVEKFLALVAEGKISDADLGSLVS